MWYNWKGQPHLASVLGSWENGPPHASLSLHVIFQMGCCEDCPPAATEGSSCPPCITGDDVQLGGGEPR